MVEPELDSTSHGKCCAAVIGFPGICQVGRREVPARTRPYGGRMFASAGRFCRRCVVALVGLQISPSRVADHQAFVQGFRMHGMGDAAPL